MWPDNETSLDLINVRHLVSGVSEIIQTDDLLPVTIGVFGGWGQGKSSLIRMIEADLKDVDGVTCVTFNGWLFESYDDAKSALMETILEEIGARPTITKKGKDLVGRLTARIDWFRTMSLAGKGALTLATGGVGGLAGLGALELAKVGLDRFKDADGADLVEVLSALKREGGEPAAQSHVQTVRGFRKDFHDLLAESGIQTLVVFIDELDRCLPTAVVETLEAIRLFLSVPNTAFVIGADEELVSHAVGVRFKSEGLETSFGRRYLEKMVQIPFRIPPMGPREMKTYMNLLFTGLTLDKAEFEELVARLPKDAVRDFGEIWFDYETASRMLGECPSELAESYVLTDQLSDVLAGGLKGNPRQLKRFLNMLLLRMRLGEHRGLDLQRRALGKLMLLEYFHPERFKELAHWQADFTRGTLAQIEAAAAAARTETAVDKEESGGGDQEVEGGQGESRDARDFTSGMAAEAQEWLTEPELLTWLQMPPALGDVDLRPYFYIAREQTGPLTDERRALTPDAEEVLRCIRSEGRVVRDRGAAKLGGLSAAEAAAVFVNVAEDVRRAEDLGSARTPPLSSLLAVIDGRPDLHSELPPLFRSIPMHRLPVAIAPALDAKLQKVSPGVLVTVVEGWAQHPERNEKLAKAAAQIKSRLKQEN